MRAIEGWLIAAALAIAMSPLFTLVVYAGEGKGP
jgi:hypothetical protein